MMKRLVYIALLLIFASGLSSAKIRVDRHDLVTGHALRFILVAPSQKDSLNAKKRQQEEDKKKIKEISRAKRQAKPEKIDEGDNVQDPKAKAKPKRERRPEGLERPPEIPRRNGN
jgi:hypothetical protein